LNARGNEGSFNFAKKGYKGNLIDKEASLEQMGFNEGEKNFNQLT